MIRKISLLLIITMLFSCVSVLSVNADTKAVNNDEYYLRALELMDVLETESKISSYSFDRVTRAEFLYTLMSCLKIDVTEKCDTVYYSDLNSDHYANRAAVAACDMGIISKSESFNPDRAITFPEAVKMCVVANGRELEARVKGGYPGGYLAVAADAYILQNVTADDVSGEITSKDAIILLYNTLTADMLVQTQYGDKNQYEEIKGVTILSQYHSLAKAEGILTSSNNSSIYHLNNSIEKNRITIGDVTYRYSGNADKYLGMNVNVYYTNDKNIQTAVYLVPVENKIVTIEDGDLWLEDSVLNYEPLNSKKIEKYKIYRSYSLVLNGKSTNKTLESILKDVTSLRLVSNDGDNVYDVVLAEVESYVYVSGIDYTSKVIYDKNSHANSISLSDDEVFYSVYDVSAGEYVDFDTIETGAVLGVYKSEDGLYVRINIYNASISGAADEFNISEGKIIISGKEYKLSNYFKSFYNSVSLTAENNYLLGRGGEVVAVDVSTSEMSWGILVKYAKDSTGLSTIKAKIFTENSEMIIVDVNKKIMVDRNIMTSEDALGVLSPAGKTKRQLVRYAFDSDGKLLRVDTKEPKNPALRPENNHVSDNYDDYDALILHRFGEIDPAASGDNPTYSDYPTVAYKYTYKSDPKFFYPKFSIKKARIFVIPSEKYATDDTKYRIRTSSVFGDDDSYSDTKLSVYNIDEFGVAQAVVYISDSTGISAPSSNSSSAVIDSITLTVDEDEIPTKKIGLLIDNNFKYYLLDNDATVTKTSGKPLCAGDIVRYRLNGDKIVSITVDFDASPGVMSGNGSVSFNTGNSKLHYQSGLLYSQSGSNICIDSTAPFFGTGYKYEFANLRHFTIPTSEIIIVNMKKVGNSVEFDSVQPGSTADLRTYKNMGDMADYIVLRQRYLSPQTLFVYRIINQ